MFIDHRVSVVSRERNPRHRHLNAAPNIFTNVVDDRYIFGFDRVVRGSSHLVTYTAQLMKESPIFDEKSFIKAVNRVRVLIVEDEVKLLSILERGLRCEGFAIDGAPTIAAGMELLKSFHYDLAILDLLLTDGTGVELLRYIRDQSKAMPVLILTARADIESKTEAFQLGADDYLTKPFSLAELSLRVHALLRRSPVVQSNVLRVADLELNRITRQVKRAGKRLELSQKEYSLVEYLFLHVGRTLSRSMIIENVWDKSFEGLTNIVDVYVGHLRRKIDEGHEVKLIRTVRGIGYSLEGHDNE